MPTRASLSSLLSKSVIFLLIASGLLFTTFRLTNLVKVLWLSPRSLATGKPTPNIVGHWQYTLSKLGIEPFQDALHPDALPFSRPEMNLRFDLRKRKRAFKLPTKSNLFITNDLSREPLTPSQQRQMLEKELQAFKKIHNDYKNAESGKERMRRKHVH